MSAATRLAPVHVPSPRGGSAPKGPSSLVKVPSAALPACAACGSRRVTHIAMTLTDGTPVEFVNCRRCEHRNWRHSGEPLTVQTVLERATKPR